MSDCHLQVGRLGEGRRGEEKRGEEERGERARLSRRRNRRRRWCGVGGGGGGNCKARRLVPRSLNLCDRRTVRRRGRGRRRRRRRRRRKRARQNRALGGGEGGKGARAPFLFVPTLCIGRQVRGCKEAKQTTQHRKERPEGQPLERAAPARWAARMEHAWERQSQ